MGGHVFISYRHGRDRGYVEALADHFVQQGLTVWFDRELVAGDRWVALIRERVDTCAALVVVMTPAAEQSDWVAREIERAAELNKPILPLLLEGRVFFRLADLQYEDVTGGRMPSATFTARLAPGSRPAPPRPTGPVRPAAVNTTSAPVGTSEPVPTGWTRRAGLIGAVLVALALVITGVVWFTSNRENLSGRTPTPPITATGTPSATTATQPDSPQAVATRFVTMWLNRDADAASWRAALSADSTARLAPVFNGLDPMDVVVARVTGPAVLTRSDPKAATVTIAVDTGVVTTTLMLPTNVWLVDSIEWART